VTRLARWAAAALAAAGLAVLGFVTPAGAATHSPCAGHPVGTPSVFTVDSGVTTLTGGGGITGCPPVYTYTSESVTITVCLERQDPVTSEWVDQACNGPVTRSWNRSSRLARSLGLTVYATCVPGVWDVVVRGGDSYAPFVWKGESVRSDPEDSGVCGAFGGGD
jgi:hypothetical protein